MSSSERYSRTAIALHWLIALAVMAQFTWGWAMQMIPKQPPGLRADAFNLHKSVGLTILAIMCLRALWRWRHRPPPLPAMPPWQSRLACWPLRLALIPGDQARYRAEGGRV